MKVTTILTLALMLATGSQGQSPDSVFSSIERNNPRLKAVGKWADAERIRSGTGIYPEGPAITYNYLWGKNANQGDLQELEVVQPFRYPGYYTSLSKVQKLQARQASAVTRAVALEVRCAIRDTWMNLAYLNKKIALLEELNIQSARLLEFIETAKERGEVSGPVADKVRILYIRNLSELQHTRSDIATEEELLKQLNGGATAGSRIYEYPAPRPVPPLDSVLLQLDSTHPYLVREQLRINEQEQRLKHEKMSNLPVFEAGYKYETILNDKLQGVHAGISVPLWENRNRVKHARLEQQVAEASYEQVKGELTAEIKGLYHEVAFLETIYREGHEILEKIALPESSLKLLSSGHITFSEYVIDIQFITESRLEYLESERNYFKKLYELLVKTGS